MPFFHIALLLAALCPVLAAASGMTIKRNQARISVAGVVSSSGHETILMETLQRDFPGLTHSVHFETGANLPAGWSLLTDLALRAIAFTQSGAVAMDFDSIRFSGYSGRPEKWHAALSRVERHAPVGAVLESEVSVITPVRSLAALCRQQFDAALRSTRIRFASGSTGLNSNDFAALDGLLELAVDCPSSRIWIRGASKSPFGSDRAQAVASYLSGHGLRVTRVSAGVADSVPAQAVYVSVTF